MKVQAKATTKTKNVKANDIKRKMSDEEFEEQMSKMKAQLNVLMDLLHNNEEYQKLGWVMRKVARWLIR